jgi:hypothetical protein
MKRFTDAGRRAVKEGNLYAALSLALTIPDICGSLVDPGAGKSKQRYLDWYTKWVLPKFTLEIGPSREKKVFISADDCYQLRCSLIHSGTAEIEPGGKSILDRFVFFDESAGSHLNYTRDGAANFLQLKAPDFANAVFDAADEWDTKVSNDAAIQAEKAKLLTIHKSGDTISGIKFG